jgi:hypothetical protein
MPRSGGTSSAPEPQARLEALAPRRHATHRHVIVAAVAEVSAIIYGRPGANLPPSGSSLEVTRCKVTKKDIEENPSARLEIREKLKRVHRPGGSIPVIDVMGQILVGFSPGALRAAVDRAKTGATL